MCSIWACDRNLLSTMRPSRRCSVTFSIFWPSNDSLTDTSESRCFCRVVIIFDFVFTGLMSMRLTLHHIEITLKYDQNKAVASFEFAFSCCMKCCVIRKQRERERERTIPHHFVETLIQWATVFRVCLCKKLWWRCLLEGLNINCPQTN